MNVVNYLKSNSLDQMKSEYSLRIKEYQEQGLIVLNYLTLAKKSAIPNECRGLILSTDWKVISRSFDRFFNYNESGCALHNNDECYAIEKIDGSIIKIYHFNSMWNVSTRGTAFAECTIADTHTTYKQAVFEALGLINAGDAINEQDEERFQQFCRDCNMNAELTYICELTGKNNHIVTQYNPHKYELWLLGIRRNDLIGEYTCVNSVQLTDTILQPKQFTFKNIEECVERANNLPDLQEGFVIYNRATSEPILKVKSPIYVHVHNFTTNGSTTYNDVCRMIVNGEWTEFLAYNPNQKHTFDECFLAIGKYFETAQAEYEELCKIIKSEKDFQKFMKKPWKALAIATFKKKEGNLREEFSNWDEAKQLEFLLKEVIRNMDEN
ncbi:uncharacterized protein LOC129565877 [Sitodiplosis mosellana]|uniref:uncharacterized protein LOC129565877 n=1 Tax=Sitodiplosis mosellana TaxID=263140 RepID=UPI002443CE66|nr:uncharacterized protein LOC129565877 [Sitodiplosis mosellana]